jgi:hypothetical protein
MRRLFSVFFLAACGGGDSGGETEQDPVYDLTEYKSLDEGEKYLFTLTGSDSMGGEWTGVMASMVRAVVEIDNMKYVPEDKLISLTETSSNLTVSRITTVFYNPFKEPVVLTFPFTYVVCFADTINLLPDSVIIGDTGETTSYTCSDSMSISGVWSVEGASDGYAYLTFDTTYMDGSGIFLCTETEKFKIDSSGKIISVSFSIYTDEATLNLSS